MDNKKGTETPLNPPTPYEVLNKQAETIDALREENAQLREAGEALKGYAQSYAMQTYDRFGTVKRAVEAWDEALKGGGLQNVTNR